MSWAQERPTLSGDVETQASEDGLFLVHFTREGRDAVGGGEVPALVTDVLAGLELGRDTFAARGYRALAEDNGAGGSPAIDIYIRDVDINGYARSWRSADGVDGSSCYMEIDPGLDVGSIGVSVVVHELMHCVQFRYSLDVDNWLSEASATFEQYRTVSGGALNLALGVLWATRLGGAGEPLEATGGRMEYASFVFPYFWESWAGDQASSPAMWEALAVDADWRATLDGEAQAVFGRDLGETFLEYATWNAFACGRDIGLHYDDTMPCLAADASVPIQDIEATGDNQTIELPSMSAAYFQLPPEEDAVLEVDCRWPREGGRLDLSLLALDGAGELVASVSGRADAGDDLLLSFEAPYDPAGSLLAVVASTGPGELTTKCAFAWSYPVVEVVEPDTPDKPERGCAVALAPAPWWLMWLWWRRRREA